MGRSLHHRNTTTTTTAATFLFFFFFFFLAVIVRSSFIGDLSDDLSSIDFAPTSTIPREKLLDDDEIVQDQSFEEDTNEEEGGLDDNDLGKENSNSNDAEKKEEEEDEKDGKEMKGRKLITTTTTAAPTMHLVITHLNKAVIFGPTVVEFDFATNKLRHMTVQTNPWFASGGLAADGTVVHTGGGWEGGNAVRYLDTCEGCEWKEHVKDLAGKRWSATQHILPDGRFIVIGGHREFSYEYVPPRGEPNKATVSLPFLKETTDQRPDVVQDNLYPFVHLSPDGNLFIFANNRSILFDYKENKVVKEFPTLQGSARNYPSPGMSAMIPLNLNKPISEIKAEVIVCGGASTSFAVEKDIDKCARMDITSSNPRWEIEKMPKPRIMADLLNLPTGDLMFINGADASTSSGEDIIEPWIYRPFLIGDKRFKVLKPSTPIPRMYHSTSAILPDGKILITGSNTNHGQNFPNDKILPTDLRIEKLSPPYLHPSLSYYRPEITQTRENLHYDETFDVVFNLNVTIEDPSDVKITMYASPFATHGYSMGQRLLILKTTGSVDNMGADRLHKIVVTAPPSAVLAPPGYYMLFLVYRGLPSTAVWVHIE